MVMEEEPATGRRASGGDTEEGMGSERERGPRQRDLPTDG